jgi:hypothetical protein
MKSGEGLDITSHGESAYHMDWMFSLAGQLLVSSSEWTMNANDNRASAHSSRGRNAIAVLPAATTMR